MNVIVPLAGPELVNHDGDIKSLEPFQGEPALKRILSSRSWARDVHRYSFVLHDRPETRAFARSHLTQWYPNSSIVYLSRLTRGAALSALAAVAVGFHFDHPLIIDLADIYYETSLDPISRLAQNPSLGGIAPIFESTHPTYSYLRTDGKGMVIEAAEKQLISCHASAGTYIFRNSAIYLRALAYVLERPQKHEYNNLYYVCPVFNGILEQGSVIQIQEVENVLDLKRIS